MTYCGITKITIAHEQNRISGTIEIRSSAGVPLYMNKEADFPGKKQWYKTEQIKKHFQESISKHDVLLQC